MLPTDSIPSVIPDAWPGVVKHIFDSVWGTVGASIATFLAGWLILKRPQRMERMLRRRTPQPVSEDDAAP